MDQEIKRWMEKVKGKEFDLSKDEDLSIALMNLISLEEHFYFSAMKTDNRSYLEMLNSVRSLRKNLLKRFVKEAKGEEWCISKHLLACSMRLMEVGTKELGEGNEKEATFYFKEAFELYSLFFAINLKLVEVKEIKNKQNGLKRRFSDIVKKLVDCCKE